LIFFPAFTSFTKFYFYLGGFSSFAAYESFFDIVYTPGFFDFISAYGIGFDNGLRRFDYFNFEFYFGDFDFLALTSYVGSDSVSNAFDSLSSSSSDVASISLSMVLCLLYLV